MSSILDGTLERAPFAGEGGQTGATFEQAVLADGTPVIIKHVTTDDWLVVAAGGVSYVHQLWCAGVFDRIPSVIDHATIAMEAVDDRYVLVMRDVSEHVLVEGRVLTREENRFVLEAADAMYQAFWDEDLPGCPVADHLRAFSLEMLPRVQHLNSPIPALMERGWDLFGDVAQPDVAEVILGLQSDSTPLARELDKRPKTLIHGDLRLHNMGLRPGRFVLLDWELAGSAPPALEFGWYLNISASRIDATREQITDDYRRILGERDDPIGLELAMIAALFMLGWNKAIDIVDNPDPAIRAQERADLDWWVARVRTALETWSPV